ncbi:hypothetical protein CSKR_102233 [Clonorchis sinensis]|uniref:Uncharacterized protein n=1 Tax=Clonorchis sinensis TaxID=79923 RepID=A0A3R7JI01_CLOSI|nr:hypothetical protein CSKR_102233 [Clonorchis sinensis]
MKFTFELKWENQYLFLDVHPYLDRNVTSYPQGRFKPFDRLRSSSHFCFGLIKLAQSPSYRQLYVYNGPLQLNVLHRDASCFSLYYIREITIRFCSEVAEDCSPACDYFGPFWGSPGRHSHRVWRELKFAKYMQ